MNPWRPLANVLVAVAVVVVASSVPLAYPLERPLPERPADLTEASATRYAESFELAYSYNDEVDGPLNPVTLSIQRVRTRPVDGGYVVHLEVGVTERRPAGVDGGRYTVNYLVTATTTTRAAVDGRARPGPDPRNGTVVAGD